MELLHAIFHRALIRAELVVAAVHQRLAAGVHAQCDLVVFGAGLPVRGLLGLDELALEGDDLFGVEKLDDVECLLRALRVQRRDDEHMRVPLDHDVGVIGQPDGPVFRGLSVAIRQQCVMPFSIGRRPGFRERIVRTDGLHRVVIAEFPVQLLAADELAQARVKRADVVVLEVDLDEGLPVVVALVQLHAVEHVAVEAELAARGDRAQVGRNVATIGFEHQPVPALRLVVVEVQARVVVEVRRTDQLAVQIVGPAVQGADDVASCIAAALQHDRLTMPADVGNQLDAARGAHQRAALAFVRQRVVVADVRHREFMPQIAGPVLKDQLHLATKQVVVEIGRYAELRAASLQSFKGDAQVGHDPQDLQKPMSNRPHQTERGGQDADRGARGCGGPRIVPVGSASRGQASRLARTRPVWGFHPARR